MAPDAFTMPGAMERRQGPRSGKEWAAAAENETLSDEEEGSAPAQKKKKRSAR